MLSWEEFVEVRNLRERGWTVTAIARHLGKDRKTVRRYLNDPDAKPGMRKPVDKLVDPYAGYIEARLEDNESLAGTVLLRELYELGFTGSYQTLARHLAEVRPDVPVLGETNGPAESVRMVHRPGAAQADWSPFFWTPAGQSHEIEIQLFGIVLCRPHFCYGEFFERQSWAHLAAGHLSAFDYIAGTPTEIRYDRTSQVFKKGTTEPNAHFGDFAAYCGFAIIPSPKGRSRTNGVIERFFGFVATSFFPTVDAASLPELNAKFRSWLDAVANTRTSEDITTPPCLALQSERAHLLPVRRPPYPLEVVVERKVDRYSLVRLDGARYSVAPGNVGAKVAVITRPGSDRVEIRRGAHTIGSHRRVSAGQIGFDPDHGAAIEALTFAALAKAGHRATKRKRNDARLGARAQEEAAMLRARLVLGDDGVVAPVDLSRYDSLWEQR
jgi:transposase